MIRKIVDMITRSVKPIVCSSCVSERDSQWIRHLNDLGYIRASNDIKNKLDKLDK